MQASPHLPLPCPVFQLLRRNQRIQGSSGGRGNARSHPIPETGSSSLAPRNGEQKEYLLCPRQIATVVFVVRERQQGSGRLGTASQAQPRQIKPKIEHVQGRLCVVGWHHDVMHASGAEERLSKDTCVLRRDLGIVFTEFKAASSTLSGIFVEVRRPVSTALEMPLQIQSTPFHLEVSEAGCRLFLPPVSLGPLLLLHVHGRRS